MPNPRFGRPHRSEKYSIAQEIFLRAAIRRMVDIGYLSSAYWNQPELKHDGRKELHIRQTDGEDTAEPLDVINVTQANTGC